MPTYTEHYNLKKPATTDFVSIADLNSNADAIDAALYETAQAAAGKISATEKGAVNGVAGLDASGKVPSSQLPSYVDDVIEGYYYEGAFYEEDTHTTVIPAETGKIYVDLATNKSYRYSGSAYFRIDEITVDATPTSGSSNPVSSGGVYTVLDGKVDKISGKGLSTEDYTTAEKTKLSGIESGAQVNPGAATTSAAGLMSAADKDKLDGIEAQANKTVVDSSLSDSSTNPVQNKIVTGKMKSTEQDDKIYHLGFYLDANGDLCY